MNRNASRTLLALMLALLLAGSFAPTGAVYAQDGEVVPAEASPPATEPPAPPATGYLSVIALTCAGTGAEPSTVIYVDAEFSPDESCLDSSGTVLVDGAGAGVAAPGLDLVLDAGWHAVGHAESGLSHDVLIVADGATTVWIVTLLPEDVPEASEAPAADPVALTLTVHICDPDIQTIDELLVAGDRLQRLAACPVVTLDGDFGPEGVVDAGQQWFELFLSGRDGFAATPGDLAFEPGAICESDLGVQMTPSVADNACFSTSTYAGDVPAGAISFATSTLPVHHRFGYATAETADETSLMQSVDRDTGTFDVNATGYAGEMVFVDVYLFSPGRLTVVAHACDDSVDGQSAFNALGSFLAKTAACPAVANQDDDGLLAFTADVQDGAGGTFSGGELTAVSFCESELGMDLDGNPANDLCLEMPGYELGPLERGSTRAVVDLVSGWTLAGYAFAPGSDDAAALLDAQTADGVFLFDTTFDGEIVLHLFGMQSGLGEPEPTPTPGVDQEASGSLRVAALYCVGTVTRTTLTALPPGQQAGSTDIGGSCLAGNARFRIVLSGGSEFASIELGSDGVDWIDGVPGSGEGQQHQLVDLVSGKSTGFAIAAGTVTRAILRVEVAQAVSETGPSTAENQPWFAGLPPDVIRSMITITLVTDELHGNYPDAGMSPEGSLDSNAFVVDLLAGLDAEEVASVGVNGLPGVGTRDGETGDNDDLWLAMGAFALLAGAGVVRNRRPLRKIRR